MPFGERHPPQPPVAWPILLGLAAARLVLHFIIGSGYGIFRDEFYYLACGARPDWGYVDQPPLVPLLARLAAAIWGYTTITAGELRTFSALAMAGLIVLAGLMARQLGGGRFAQGLAALAVACGPIYLAVGDLFETVVFDQLCWALAGWLVLRAWQREPGRGWLLVGLAAGIGLETKFTMGLFGLGLAAALLLASAGRRHLRTPWPWLGGVIALTLLAPNLWWQHANGWPTAEFIHNNNEWNRKEWTWPKFMLSQLEYLNLTGMALATAGLWRVFSKREDDGGRALGWIFVVALALLLVTRGKPYYLGPAYPGLLAAGAVAAEGWTARRLALAQSRWLRPAMVGGVILLTLPLAPVALPLVPHEKLAGSWVAKLQHDYGEMFGWQELTTQVEGIFLSLPPADRAQAVVQGGNYGEVAAIEHFGHLSRTEMPLASGHNNYALWRRGQAAPPVAVIIAHNRDWLDKAYEQVEQVATVENPLGIDNEERGKGIFICRRLRDPKNAEWAGGTYFQ